MEPIKKTRLSDKVIDAIETMIVENQLGVGDRFFSENELAKRLQVSRSSIREAMRVLEARGRVIVRHGKGAYIADPREKPNDPFVEWLKVNKASLLDHFEVRLIIEPKAAWRAAESACSSAIRMIEEAHNAFVQSVERSDVLGFIKADEDFHRFIAQSTNNKTLYLLMKTMTELLSDGWIASLHIQGRAEKTVLEHGEILAAIKNGDKVKAEKEMFQHLSNAINDIRASMESQVNPAKEE
ncbi:MAG TPA: FadR family transcriptional regulator [Synergistaceae bacterium]|nr:FadR family transcriptional regulator [Synergistaceae bacterium]